MGNCNRAVRQNSNRSRNKRSSEIIKGIQLTSNSNNFMLSLFIRVYSNLVMKELKKLFEFT